MNSLDVALPLPSIAPSTGSGPAVARLFHRALALIHLVAWISLGAQVDSLVGSRGLLPLASHVADLRASGASFADFPSLFWFASSDGALFLGIGVGVALSIAAFAGLRPRLCFAALTLGYASYAIACQGFLAFQWDNLLVESSLLAALLPSDTRSPIAHGLMRVLLFKLYVESGLAKLGSALHDWHDGSAMTFYFETAPIPTRLAWYAHHLPATLLHLAAWFTLLFELAVPFALFGPRKLRFAAGSVFTAFQLVNQATANYGFFCALSTTLHLFVLGDVDVARLRAFALRNLGVRRPLRFRARLRALRAFGPRLSLHHFITRFYRWIFASLYVGLSALGAVAHFGGSALRSLPLGRALLGAYVDVAELRMVNTYHLFAQITRERVEPTVETFERGTWKEHALRYKPGPVDRAPPFVAPHQPRLDFLLWFYGLGFHRGSPDHATALLDRLCHDRTAVSAFFEDPPPLHPEAARFSFWRYHFTTPREHDETGAWWTRERLGALAPLRCHDD
jgi:hypothetical protein